VAARSNTPREPSPRGIVGPAVCTPRMTERSRPIARSMGGPCGPAAAEGHPVAHHKSRVSWLRLRECMPLMGEVNQQRGLRGNHHGPLGELSTRPRSRDRGSVAPGRGALAAGHCPGRARRGLAPSRFLARAGARVGPYVRGHHRYCPVSPGGISKRCPLRGSVAPCQARSLVQIAGKHTARVSIRCEDLTRQSIAGFGPPGWTARSDIERLGGTLLLRAA
jgi:hypothetical protein